MKWLLLEIQVYHLLTDKIIFYGSKINEKIFESVVNINKCLSFIRK